MGLIDRRPRGPLRIFLRAPIVLYRAGLGRLFGHRLLYLVHKGRTSGRRREAVLEVVHYDPWAPEVVVVSGWGERSDWFRNIAAAPAVEIRCGEQRWPSPGHHVLDTTETVRLLQDYRDLRPRAWGRIAPMLGLPRDPGDAAREGGLARIRAVSFTPEGNP